MLEPAIIVHSLKANAVLLGTVRTGIRSKWMALFLRKYLLLKGMLIHSLSCHKAFDSCFECLLLRLEMMVLCSSLTKNASGAWSFFPFTTGPAAPSPPALGAHGCVLCCGEQGQKTGSPLEDFGRLEYEGLQEALGTAQGSLSGDLENLERLRKMVQTTNCILVTKSNTNRDVHLHLVARSSRRDHPKRNQH